jgi:hypothetical protein
MALKPSTETVGPTVSQLAEELSLSAQPGPEVQRTSADIGPAASAEGSGP